MAKRKKIIERRRQDRFKVKDGFFAALTSENKIGQINEIGKRGLTFQYVDNGTSVKTSAQIDIFSTSYDFYLRNMPVKSIVDFEIDSTVPLSSLPMKQVNVQFGKMSSTQKMLLDFFLQKYTLK
ncbi:hypothetical protein ACFL7E_09070 [Thermodesulfobacteriota bacterium]